MGRSFNVPDFVPSLMLRLSFVGVLACLALAFGFVMAKGYLPLMPLLPRPGATGVGTPISEYDAQGLVIIAMALVLIFGVWLIPKMAQGDESRWLLKLLVIGFAAKMMAALVRLWMNYDIYGFRDVARYHRGGETVATYIRSFEFSALLPYMDRGTDFTILYTGIIFSIVGPTLYGGFLIFAALSFLGSYFFYQTFRIAFPGGNYRLFGILIFLLPSILYWPNGIGKDALMFLFIGLAAYGGALLLLRWRLVGLAPLVIGLTVTLTIREPVGWMIVIGLVAMFLLGRARSKSYVTRVYRVALLAIGIGFIWIALPSMLGEVGLEEASFDASAVESVDQFFAQRQSKTAQGGSGFDSTSFSDPSFLPVALATALFRPFPWEVHNLQSFIQAMDGVLLMGLMVWRGPSIIQAIRSFRSSPYIIFILVYSFIMILALMIVANFGTLVRERAMLLPFILMLVAFQPAPKEVPSRAAPGKSGSSRLPGHMSLKPETPSASP